MAPEVTAGPRDADIVSHLQHGELARAFDLIMERYAAKIHRLCVAYLRNPSHAEDAAQESLVRLWRALAKYDARAALSTWIYAITRNRCLTLLAERRGNISLNETTIQTEVEALAAADDHEASDAVSTLRQLVEQLPRMQRLIVILYYFEERSVGEVSERVGLPAGTVKTHLFRARAQLLATMRTLDLADRGSWNSMGE